MKITDLKGAVARIGFANVRTASLAYAMQQIRNAPALAPIRQPLNELWEHSVKMAAMAFVAARRWTRVSPDQALLAGLMHGVGKVYILARSAEHPDAVRRCRALPADRGPTGMPPSPRRCWRAGISPRTSSRRWAPTSSWIAAANA